MGIYSVGPTKPMGGSPPPSKTWDELQQMLRSSVTSAMEDFYTQNARILKKLEVLIDRELLPQLVSLPRASGRMNKEAHRSMNTVLQLLQRLSCLRPVVVVRMNNSPAPRSQPKKQWKNAEALSSLSSSLPSQSVLHSPATKVRPPPSSWKTGSPVKLTRIGTTALPPTDPRFGIWQRQQQGQLKRKMHRKSANSLHLRRHKDYQPVPQSSVRGRRRDSKNERPVSTLKFGA